MTQATDIVSRDSERRTYGWLLATAFVLFILPGLIGKYTPYSWLVGDGGFYLNMQKSLTWFGTIEQSWVHPHSWYDGHREINDAFSNIAVGAHGEWWPKHGYVMPIVALPFYWIFGAAGTLVFNVLSVTALVVLSFAVACRFTRPGPAAVAAFVIGIAGPHVDYAYNFSNDGFYSVLVLAAFLAALRPLDAPGEPHVVGYRVLAGVLIGLAVWTKITNVLFAPLLWVAAVSAGPWSEPNRLQSVVRATRDLVLGAAIPMSAFGLANWVMFGRPWITSYQRVLVVQGGQTAIASHTGLFNVPLKEGLDDLLFASERGLLTRYAMTTLGWLGLGGLVWRRPSRALAIGFVATSLFFFWFFARFRYYHERFLFPYFGLLVTPSAVLLADLIAVLRRVSVSSRRRVAVAALVVTLAGGVALLLELSRRAEPHLADHVERARVYLGDARCDYFNNMRWSWECDGARGEEQYIGINANQKHLFGGVEATGLIYAPGHETRRPVRIVFPNMAIPGEIPFRFGLDDKSKDDARVELTVFVGEQQVLQRMVTEVGTLFEAPIDTSRLAGTTADIVVAIETRDRERARLCFDARLPSGTNTPSTE